MMNFIFSLMFQIISFSFKMAMCLENLISEFIRYIFIPLWIYNDDKHKIIKDIASIDKKPIDQVILAVNIDIKRQSDLPRIMLKIANYVSIIKDSINPQHFSCFFSTINLNNQQYKQLRNFTILFTQNIQINVVYDRQVDYLQRIVVQKAKITPLVIFFSSLPSIINLPAQYLIGSEIYFAPEILKTMDYDIYSAFNRYALSQQRKGK